MSDVRNIHEWFGLTYASYLVLPRSALQSMSEDWQVKFVELLEDMHDKTGDIPTKGTYYVYLRSQSGCFMKDEFRDYRHVQFPLK